MGVYNPNAIIPNNCAVCNEECKYRNITAHKRHKRCPLIEVKTPHGRLIDADKLTDKSFESDVFLSDLILETEVYLAPTVIEAEG